MSPKRRRKRFEPTDDWEQLELLCAWPEQVRYELIRPMALFGASAAERSRQTGAASERTLYRRMEHSESDTPLQRWANSWGVKLGMPKGFQ